MGLAPLQAIYHARFMKYMNDRSLAATEGRKVWAFMGDVGGRATAAAGGWGNMWGNFGASAGAMLIPWLMKVGGGDGKTIVFFTLAGAFVLAGLIVLPMDATKKLIAEEPSH